jgi:hypothetical protein
MKNRYSRDQLLCTLLNSQWSFLEIDLRNQPEMAIFAAAKSITAQCIRVMDENEVLKHRLALAEKGAA